MVRIPVIGSGDVKRVEDIEKLRRYSSCDAVMIGRAAIANPWIFSRLNREQVSSEQVRATVQDHLERSVKFYGEEDGQRLFRKYAVQYLLLQTLSRETRKRILQKNPTGQFLKMLNEVYAAV
jgi:tRNA-dihydrouridine synthase